MLTPLTERAEKLRGYHTTVSLNEDVKRMVEWAKTIGPQEFQYLDKLERTSKIPQTWSEGLI